MKILFPFIGDTIGGSHKSAIDYIVELKKKNIDVKILLLKKKSYLSKYLNSKNLNYDILDLPVIKLNRNIIKIFISLISGFFKARRYLNQNKIKIVHTNDIRNHYVWAIWSLFISNHIWHQRTIWPKSIFFYFFIFFCKKIFCNSQYLYDEINFQFIKRKSYLVSNIIYSQKKYIPKKNNKIIIGSFSNIQKIKRPDIIIGILKKIVSKRLNIEIHCFGSDNENLIKEYSKKIRYKENFKYFNHKIDTSLFMKKCDYVIATSENDTLGRTILEAMSFRIPVFATNSGGHKYIIKNNINGFLFNIEKNNILKKVQLIQNNKILKKKIINNALNYLKEYDKQKILTQLLNAYEN